MMRLAWPVGTYIREELAARGWSNETLADAMGVSVGVVQAMMAEEFAFLLEGDDAHSELADKLGRAFGTSSSLWVKLDLAYWLWVGGAQGIDKST